LGSFGKRERDCREAHVLDRKEMECRLCGRLGFRRVGDATCLSREIEAACIPADAYELGHDLLVSLFLLAPPEQGF